MTQANPLPASHTREALISRHTTSDGVVVWSRCACGRLRMVRVPYSADGERLSAAARTRPCSRCEG
ncbi:MULTISPECIES: hypothetical protein [Thermomonosporaceae]|uniref:hypothetical protein n=1 Tax=Thermomonosporaceae TaxID=2012 RepID=UPI00255A853E|nr:MULTISPECIES: hypothetical protein [Thermomonosporaceae]MDL4774891.1 hypothetical protein [Actinomadura xylanilytica]